MQRGPPTCWGRELVQGVGTPCAREDTSEHKAGAGVFPARDPGGEGACSDRTPRENRSCRRGPRRGQEPWGKRRLQLAGAGGRSPLFFHTRIPGLIEVKYLSRLLSWQAWEAGFWELADRLELDMDTWGREKSGSSSTPFAARPDDHETMALCAAVLAEAVLEAH